MKDLDPRGTNSAYPDVDPDTDPRLQTEGRLTGQLPQQATGEGVRGENVPVDTETYQYPTSRQGAHNLAQTTVEKPVDAPEAPGFWTKKKAAITAGIAGLALTAGTIAGVVINKSGDKPAGVSPLDEEPNASAPLVPGEQPAPTLENVTIETYGYQVNGETVTGSAELAAKHGISGEILEPQAVVGATFDALNTWVNSGATEEEKKASESFTATSGTTGIDGVMEDIYDPAFTSVLTTDAYEAMDPNRPAGIGNAGVEAPTQLINMVTEWHTSHTEHGVETQFVPRSEINILASPTDPYLKVQDGNRNNIAVVIDQVAVVQKGELDGQPVDVTTERWNFSLLRVPDETNGGTIWKVVSFTAAG